jgi:hypothetical protein
MKKHDLKDQRRGARAAARVSRIVTPPSSRGSKPPYDVEALLARPLHNGWA